MGELGSSTKGAIVDGARLDLNSSAEARKTMSDERQWYEEEWSPTPTQWYEGVLTHIGFNGSAWYLRLTNNDQVFAPLSIARINHCCKFQVGDVFSVRIVPSQANSANRRRARWRAIEVVPVREPECPNEESASVAWWDDYGRYGKVIRDCGCWVVARPANRIFLSDGDRVVISNFEKETGGTWFATKVAPVGGLVRRPVRH